MVGQALGVVGAVAAVWGLYLGILFWTAGGEPEKTAKAKTAVKHFVIGIIVIFAVAGLTPILISALSTWVWPT